MFFWQILRAFHQRYGRAAPACTREERTKAEPGAEAEARPEAEAESEAGTTAETGAEPAAEPGAEPAAGGPQFELPFSEKIGSISLRSMLFSTRKTVFNEQFLSSNCIPVFLVSVFSLRSSTVPWAGRTADTSSWKRTFTVLWAGRTGKKFV